jgi:hypothetical protein
MLTEVRTWRISLAARLARRLLGSQCFVLRGCEACEVISELGARSGFSLMQLFRECGGARSRAVDQRGHAARPPRLQARQRKVRLGATDRRGRDARSLVRLTADAGVLEAEFGVHGETGDLPTQRRKLIQHRVLTREAVQTSTVARHVGLAGEPPERHAVELVAGEADQRQGVEQVASRSGDPGGARRRDLKV